jgi:hypothetical protein
MLFSFPSPFHDTRRLCIGARRHLADRIGAMGCTSAIPWKRSNLITFNTKITHLRDVLPCPRKHAEPRGYNGAEELASPPAPLEKGVRLMAIKGPGGILLAALGVCVFAVTLTLLLAPVL